MTGKLWERVNEDSTLVELLDDHTMASGLRINYVMVSLRLQEALEDCLDVPPPWEEVS